jgi:hypothetical protein
VLHHSAERMVLHKFMFIICTRLADKSAVGGDKSAPTFFMRDQEAACGWSAGREIL